MKLICERDRLSSALAHASRRAERKSKIPILQQVLLEAAQDKLALTGTDLDTRTVATTPAEITQGGATTVNADRLGRLVDGMPKGAQVRLELKGSELHIECSKSRYRLPVLPAEDFPDMSKPGDTVEIPLTSAIAKRLFEDAAAAISSDDTRIYFTGAFLSQHGRGLMMTGCDGIRLVRVTSPPTDVKLHRGYLIHRSAMAEVAKLASGGDVTLRFSDNLIEATCGNVVFTSKLVDATYPDADRVIPQLSPHFIQVDRADFIAALKRLVGVANEHSSITIAWKPGDKTIELSSTGEGSGAEEIACDCDLEAGEIRFSQSILLAMIDVISGSTMQLHITGPANPMRIVDPDDQSLTVVAMPRHK
jgi:DNA polymerase III, beta subunit